jgi:hypothetical protein
MDPGKLSKEFETEASPPPPVLSPEAYRMLLEKLLGEGKGYGKTEAVAAYLLRDMGFMEETPKGDVGHKVKVQPLYVVMDLKEWPNEYGRSLVMQEIMVQYAKRMVGENEMNAPDFKAPGLWTNKPGSFEFDYIRRQDANGNFLNIYDANPEAYRVCFVVSAPVTIPTSWGKPWPIGAGGALAIRERDVPGLAAALQSIRDGQESIEEALFTTREEDGATVTKFDVYGMMPGFITDNYKPVPLKDMTRELSKPYAPPTSATMPVLRFKK